MHTRECCSEVCRVKCVSVFEKEKERERKKERKRECLRYKDKECVRENTGLCVHACVRERGKEGERRYV